MRQNQRNRRWVGWLAVAALAWASLGGQAFAAPGEQTKTVSVTANVSTTFTLTLNVSTLDLSGNPGDTKNGAVIATAKSNYAVAPWILKIATNQMLTDSSQTPAETIPLANFTHTSSGGTGSRVDGSDVAFNTSNDTYYTAADSEKNNLSVSGTAITSTYKVVIPAGQAAGTYTATVTHTMTVTGP